MVASPSQPSSGSRRARSGCGAVIGVLVRAHILRAGLVLGLTVGAALVGAAPSSVRGAVPAAAARSGRLRGRALPQPGPPRAGALGPPPPVPWEAKVDRALAAIARRAPAATPWTPPPASAVPAPAGLTGPFAPTFRPTDDGSPVEYVIVTGEALAGELERLADWKTRKGVRAVVRTVEWIDATNPGGVDRAARIRAFLRDTYRYWGTLWVLLAGDTGIVPVRYARSQALSSAGEEIPADLYYACLDGTWNADGDALFGEALPPGQPAGGDDADLLPELWVGRAPVSSVSEARSFTDRVLAYEQDPPLGAGYAGSLLLLGEYLGGELDGAAFCEQVAARAPPGTRAVRLYENDSQYPGALPENVDVVTDSLNAGFAVVDHVGHGFRTTMSVGVGALDNAAADGLVNQGRLSAVVAINCSSGAFDFNAIGERFVLAPAGGAIAFIGMSRFALPVVTADYQNLFFDFLWADSLRSVGAALASARAALVPLSEPGESASRWTQLALNLLGDPETALWTRPPERLAVSHAASVALGGGSFAVTVEAAGTPVAGATVCLDKDDAYAVGTTGAGGVATLDWRPESPGSFWVTATLAGSVPALSQAEVTAASAPFLAAVTQVIDDAAGGNGDGRADQGEAPELVLTILNTGGAAASAVRASLAGAPPLVAVTGDTVALGSLAAGASAEARFPLAIADEVPPASKPLLALALAAAEGTFDDLVALPLHTPELALLDHLLDDGPPAGNRNGVAEPGERLDWRPIVQNRGNGAAIGVRAALRILDRSTGLPAAGVTLADTTALIGDLEPFVELEGDPFTFTLGSDLVPGELRLEVRLWAANAASRIAGADLEPPPPPAGLAAASSSDQVTLSWQAPGAADLLGYDVYRGESPFGPFERLTPRPVTAASRYTVAGLPGFTTFHFGVVARDSSSNRSPISAVLSVATGPPLGEGWPIAMAQESAAAVVAGNLDGLPGLEIATGADAVYVWHADGTELRDGDGNPQSSGVFSTDGRSTQRGYLATPAIADLDADGRLDIVASAWDAHAVYAWSADGAPLAGWPQDLGFDFNWAAPVVDDLDADGDLEVLVVGGKLGKLYGWHHDGSEIRDGDGDPTTHGVLFATGTTFLYATPAVGDVDGDGSGEIVLGENAASGRLHVLDHLGREQQGFPRALGGQVTASAALADLDADGRLDIVVSAESDSVFAIDGLSGADLPGWPRPATTFTATGRTSSPVVCQLDGAGGLEVIDAASDGRMHVWNHLGEPLAGWESVRFSDLAGDATQATPVVADVDGDGRLDVLVGAEDGVIYGWNDDGTVLAGFPLPVGGEIRGAPVVWDLDEDGLLELAVSAFDRRTYVWDLPAPLALDRIGWPFMRHDVRNTGRLGADFLATAIGATPPPAAPRLVLDPAVPNPTRGPALIGFALPAAAGASGSQRVRLRLYDVQGRLVRRLLAAPLAPGRHRVRWDGRDARGQEVASGIYFLRLETATGGVRSGRLAVLR